MKIKVRNGKTYIEEDGKDLPIAVALLKYPKIAKTAMEYSKAAKQLGKIEYKNFEKTKIVSLSTQNEFKRQIFFANTLLDTNQYDPSNQIEGSFFANKKTISRENYSFIQNFLNGVDIDPSNGKLNMTKANLFNIENLIYSNLITDHGRGDGCSFSGVCACYKVLPDLEFRFKKSNFSSKQQNKESNIRFELVKDDKVVSEKSFNAKNVDQEILDDSYQELLNDYLANYNKTELILAKANVLSEEYALEKDTIKSQPKSFERN